MPSSDRHASCGQGCGDGYALADGEVRRLAAPAGTLQGTYGCSSRQSEPRLVRHRRHHAALAVRAGRGDARVVSDRHVSSTRRSSRSTLARLMPATSSASASTPATRCAATRSATLARARGASVVFGGIHATLYPDEALSRGGAHAVVKGDGDVVVAGRARRLPRPARCSRVYEGGRDRRPTSSCRRAGICCPRAATCGPRCRPCAAARSTARSARSGAPTARSRAQRGVDAVVEEIVELRRRGFRFIALADDNFYPVTLDDLAHGRAPRRQGRGSSELQALRAERFELMERLAKLPNDMVFFTQITMEAAEDPEFLDAMQRAQHQGRAGRRRSRSRPKA